MSFGESIFVGGFNQKTIKEDLFVKANHVYGKTLEDPRRLSTKDRAETLTREASRPHP
jgi:hypothetical protein